MRRKSIGVFLVMLFICIAGLTIQGSAMSLTEFNQKKDAFLSDARWRDGTSWGGSQGPKSSSWSSSGCCAYAADFAKEVYGNNSPSGGTAFYNVSEIRTGDILHINNGATEHWFIVLARNGDQIYSAEGNYSGKVHVSTSHYWFSNGVLYTQLASGTRQVTLYTGYHFLDGVSRFEFSIEEDKTFNTKDGYKIGGWVFDKQAPSTQVAVHVYVGAPANTGEGHNLGSTDRSRGDVNNAYGISGNHGFEKTFTTAYSGTQTIYIYAVTADGSYNELLATKTLLIGNDPIGNVEEVTSPCAGVIRVKGWTIDKDGEGYSNSIHVYVGAASGQSGAEGHAHDVNNETLFAHEKRLDVDEVHHFGQYHGFEVYIPTNKTGTQMVYVYGINLGNGSNAAIGNKQVTISSAAHTYVDGDIIRAATTSTAGSMEHSCSKCGKKETITIPKIADMTLGTTSYTYDGSAKQPSVTVKDANGSTIPSSHYSVTYSNNVNPGTATAKVTFTGSKYSGELSKTFQIISSHTHSYTSTVTTEPTCAATGVRTFTCSCGDSYIETIPKLTTHAPSDIVTDEAVPATCIATGLTEGSHCSRCGTVIVQQQETPVLSTHTWEDTATVDKEPTCTEEGLQSIHCSLCGAVKPGSQESIPADHKWDEGTEIIKATCTEKGAKLYICSVDNQTKTEEIPALGHDWGDWTVTKEATVDAEGEEQRICKRNPEHVETRKTPKKSVPSVPAPAAVEKDLYGNVVVSETEKEKQILALTNDNDPAGSTYSLLQAQAKKVSKTSITVTWKKVSGATAYVVYGNKCGKANKYQKITTVTGTSFTQKELKKGTYYKYLIVATGGGKALATSKTIHAATGGGKVGNAKSVKITSKKKVSLKKGKTSRIKASAVAKSSKLKMKKHRAIAFETSNPKIATVDKKGKIKGVGKGKCTIYVYAQNGVTKTVKVTVK